MGGIPVVDDIAMGWDYLGAIHDGDIKSNDIVLMVSLNGAQLYDSKESNCWISPDAVPTMHALINFL